MIRRRFAVLVAVLAATLTVLAGCDFSVYKMPLPGGTDTGTQAMRVKVEFSDVLDLVPQSRVKVDDVDVGKVTSVDLEDDVAVVTLELRKDTELPANAVASIGQTSLLGEKYVELDAPSNASTTTLADGDRIPLARSGRNPEVEEVLGALSLILNGGGVAQLKTISTELNDALEGHEGAAKSVLNQVDLLMRNLDNHKDDLTQALESVTALSREMQNQRSTINATLDELPAALTSLDKQRDDLVRMLSALDQLGNTGVRVIKASKENTIDVVRSLEPTLTQLGLAGDDFVASFNTLLTYPFVDEAVGATAQQARNLHMGDYVNLDITLNLDLRDPINNPPTVPGLPRCYTLGQMGSKLTLDKLLQDDKLLGQLCNSAIDNLNECLLGVNAQKPGQCLALPIDVAGGVLKSVGNLLASGDLACGILDCPGRSARSGSGTSGDSGGSGESGGLFSDWGDGLDLSGANRASVGAAADGTSVSLGDLAGDYDPGLVTMLVPALDPSLSGGGR